MRIGRIGLCALVAISMLITTAGCANDGHIADSNGSQLSPLRVALFPAGNTLPVEAAVTRGIFERHGLNVTVTEGQDLPLFMAAQSKGQYDIAMSVPTLVLVGAQRGLGLQIVSSTAQQTAEHPNAVWITKDASIKSLADLRGKTIAVPSLTGIITDSVVYLLQRNRLTRNDVHLVQTPFPVMGDQLQAGRVDAVVATLPFSAAIAARGFQVHDDVIVEAVRDASGGDVDQAITTVWTVSQSFAAEHPHTIAAWRASLREAIDSLRADAEGARALMAEWLKMPAAILDSAPLPDWTVDITARQLKPYVVIARDAGSIDSDPDVNSLVWQGP
ncbi:ABC transporter substrate-binding protein [Mycolicibacterium psychrotolerans]|nr:ABC transporter substrate-binding protein [Mycolicibacterium psychrotolerans]